jgi:hypothetical protein
MTRIKYLGLNSATPPEKRNFTSVDMDSKNDDSTDFNTNIGIEDGHIGKGWGN